MNFPPFENGSLGKLPFPGSFLGLLSPALGSSLYSCKQHSGMGCSLTASVVTVCGQSPKPTAVVV